MTYHLFCNVTSRRCVFGSRISREIRGHTLEDETTTLSRNVEHQVLSNAV
jgi:hypothetical protein